MFKNYLTVAFRNLLRHRLYTAINVLGLSIGIGSFIIALAFVRYELSWDRHHKDHDRIFRVLWVTPSLNQVDTKTPGALGPALKKDFTEIEDYVRTKTRRVWVKKPDGSQIRESLCVTDPSFLDVFSVDLLRGSKTHVFQNPHSVVITESTAHRWFATDDPIGRAISIKSEYNAGDYVITGVLKDLPPNTSSTLRFDLLTTTKIGSESAKTPIRHKEVAKKWDEWHATAHARSIQTFVKLRSPKSADRLPEHFRDFNTRYFGKEVASQHTYQLQPLDDIHLYSRAHGLNTSEGDIESLYQVGLIAFLVVFIGCINFINLATARASRRQKEIGVRKVTGANRKQIIAQFSFETLLLATTAAIVGMVFAEMIFPTFLAHSGLTLSEDIHPIREALPYLPFFVVILALLAGAYPSLVLASFHPIHALKPTSSIEAGNATFRKGLVLMQFAVCILLISGTLVMNDQVDFMRNRPLGFDRDLIISMPIFSRDRERKPNWGDHLSYDYKKVKARLMEHPNIIKASAFRSIPGTDPGIPRTIEIEGQRIQIRVIEADEAFLDLFEMPLIAGHNFHKSALHWRAKREYILNASAVKHLKWDTSGSEGAVGKPFNIRDGYQSDGSVVGVISDFQVGSLHTPIEPVAIHYVNDMFSYMGVKIKPDHIPETIAHLETVWEHFLPESTFEYAFLDDNIHQLYISEEQAARLTANFSILAILLGCMGLFGLASFTVERRKKEIAIRKTLGATVSRITMLLSRESVLLVIASNLIAWPIGFYLMGSWLEQFTDRINLHLGFFAIAGTITLLVALGTVAHQAIRAAYANPVDALRDE